VADLHGHTVARYDGVVPTNPERNPRAVSATTSLAELVLDAFGITGLDVQIVENLSADEIARRFKRGTLDAVFGTTYYRRDAFVAAATSGGLLVPIEGVEIDRLRERFPFIRYALVAPGTYIGQSQAIRTIGIDLLLVCRSGLDADLVYELTRHYFASLPVLLSSTDSLERVGLERASASPIPLHDGAARYYRESELYR
jgi:TRAP transporter TAXI family solute receptor